MVNSPVEGYNRETRQQGIDTENTHVPGTATITRTDEFCVVIFHSSFRLMKYPYTKQFT